MRRRTATAKRHSGKPVVGRILNFDFPSAQKTPTFDGALGGIWIISAQRYAFCVFVGTSRNEKPINLDDGIEQRTVFRHC